MVHFAEIKSNPVKYCLWRNKVQNCRQKALLISKARNEQGKEKRIIIDVIADDTPLATSTTYNAFMIM